MKRILLFILCVFILSISTSGCKQEKKAYSITTPIHGLRWGMDQKAVVSTLNLKDYKTRKVSDYMVDITTEEKYNLYGAKVSLHITLNDDLLSGFIAKISQEDLDTVKMNLTDELGEGQYDYSVNADSSINDVLSIAWHDTLLKDKPEYFERIKKVYSEVGLNTSDMNLKKLGDRSLITYELILDKNSAKYGLLTIDGSLAALLNYPDRANRNAE
jgi:hypothetical protein